MVCDNQLPDSNYGILASGVELAAKSGFATGGETFKDEQYGNAAKQLWTSGLSLYPPYISLSFFFLQLSATKIDSWN